MAESARRILPLVAAAVAAALAATSGAAVADPAGVRGVVLDTTCYGPCAIDDTPEPYAGEALQLVIRKPADESFLRRATPDEGHFRVRLARGVYRITARIPDRCWEGETKRFRVRRGEFTRVVLHVHNACIV